MSESSALDPRVFADPMAGPRYQLVLEWLHAGLKPRTYLEIGLFGGDSFCLSRCPAIGVDPVLRIPAEALTGRPVSMLFEMTSDRFFASHNPSKLFGASVDFAFLDGLHVFEALLRDFINVERHCAHHSVLALHDCVPTDLGMARSRELPRLPDISRDPGAWTGDVWKIVPVLKRYRPDLRVHVFDSRPTGLVLITGLDPENRVLENGYWKILDEYRQIDLGEIGVDALVKTFNVQPADLCQDIVYLAQNFVT